MALGVLIAGAVLAVAGVAAASRDTVSRVQRADTAADRPAAPPATIDPCAAATRSGPDGDEDGLVDSCDPNRFGPTPGTLRVDATGAFGAFDDADDRFEGTVTLVDPVGTLVVGDDGTWTWTPPMGESLLVVVTVEADDGEHPVAEHTFIWPDPEA